MKMNPARFFLAMLLTFATTANAANGAEITQANNQGRQPHDTLFLTATNALRNSLAVINTRTRQVEYIPTGGSGVVGGNGGGVAVKGDLAVVINYGSVSVTPFVHIGNTMKPGTPITTQS